MGIVITFQLIYIRANKEIDATKLYQLKNPRTFQAATRSMNLTYLSLYTLLSRWEFNFEKSIIDNIVRAGEFQIAYDFNKSASYTMKTTILRFTRSKKTSDGFFTLRNQFSGKYLQSISPAWTTVNGKYITLWSLHL